MRDLNMQEQRDVAGGMVTSGELVSWVPSRVLANLLAGGLSLGPGQISFPVRGPGALPGPVFAPSPTYLGGPVGLPYDC